MQNDNDLIAQIWNRKEFARKRLQEIEVISNQFGAISI